MAEVTDVEVTEEIQQPSAEAVVVKSSDPKIIIFIGLIIFIIILMLVIAGAGFYMLQQQRQQMDATYRQQEMELIETNKQINTYQAQLAAMQSQLATMDADVTGKDTFFNKKLQDFSELHNEKLDSTRSELKTDITRLQRQLGKTRGDWLVADAEYLLSVANQRLQLIGDVNTTREALVAADQRLRESGDASVYKVREQIAKDLDELSRVQAPDIVGLFASVQALKEHTQDLAVLLPYAGKEMTPSSSIHYHDDPAENNHGVLDLIFSQLQGYVTLRHSDMPIKEVLTQEEAMFIKNQMGAKLEMIKLALVQQDDQLFKAAIDDAQKWLKENFAQNDAANAFEEKLNALHEIPLKGHFPDISVSLKMLRDIVKLRIENDKATDDNDADQEMQMSPALQPEL